MGQQRDGIKLAQGMWHGWLVLIDIKARTRDGTCVKGGDQRGFVNNFTARNIDKMRSRFQGVKNACVDQVGRFRAARGGDDKKVNFGCERLKVRDLCRWKINLFWRAIEKFDAHTKAEVAAPCDGLPDTAHAYNADSFSADVAAEHLRWRPASPIA